MFEGINRIDIHGGVFTMENHTNANLERLRPSHKAHYKTILGEQQALKREECTAGTRVKILEDITKWANDSSSESSRVFWLTGQAGSGKTTIAYTITKHFENRHNTEMRQTVLGANFFCSRQFEETRQQTRIIPTIAYQLAQKSKHFSAALHDNLDAAHHDIPSQLNNLFVRPWQSTRSSELPLYLIVIDALDEIQDNEGSAFLQDLLTVIDESKLRGFKFLVTSRSDPELVGLCNSFITDAVCWLQHVPIEQAASDIRTYLEAKLPRLVSSPELSELVRQADGLFIYAATVVKYLTRHRSITAREQITILKTLISKSYSRVASANNPTFFIDTLYRQIMLEAFSAFTDEILTCRLRILYTFLCTAERTSTSVVAALVGEEDDSVAQAVAQDLHAVLYTQDDRVFWYHSSFPDFIFDQSRSNFDNFAFWCNQAGHHKLLGESCFHVLKCGLRFNMGDIQSSFLFDRDNADELSAKINDNISGVLRYSIRHWTHHLPSPPLINTDNLCFCISEFLQIRVLFWIEAMNLLRFSNQCTPMLRHAREWALKCGSNYLGLARDIGEAANFATYFTGSPAAESTPHLYISSLATWRQDTELCRNWKKTFSRIPEYTHTRGRISVPLMTIMAGSAPYVVAFSKDGMRIVSGLDDGTVRVWDASTGVEMTVLRGHTQTVKSVAFSMDGSRIVSGSSDMTLRVWDASTGAELNVSLGHTAIVNSVAFSADSMRIVSGSDDMTLRVWDTSLGAKLKVMTGGTVESVAFSMDGMRIVSGSYDTTVRVWDASTGAELNVLKGHKYSVRSVAFSMDDMRIVSGSDDRTVRVWDASTGAVLNVLMGHTYSVNSVAFSVDGMRIVSGSDDKTVRVWDTSTGAVLNMLTSHTQLVNSVAFSMDDMRIISGSHDKTVRVWDVSPGAEMNMLKGHTGTVNSVAFSMDGMRIVSGSRDWTVRVWDAFTGAELNVLEGHTNYVNSVMFLMDGTRIVSGSSDNTARVWDALTGAMLNVLNGHTDWVTSVAFSMDSARIVSGSHDETVRVWDALTSAELNVLNSHTDSVTSVAFSMDSTRIASASDDKTVRVWDASTGAMLNVLGHTYYSVTSVAFSMDGMQVMSGFPDNSVRVCDTLTGAVLDVLKRRDFGTLSVAFSMDGMRVVSGLSDNTVRVWDLSTAAAPNMLKGHTARVNSVAFSMDGMRIVSGSADNSVRVWNASTSAELSGRRHLPWRLTDTNWIVSSHGQDHLMWVPPEAQVTEPSAILIISRDGFGSVDFRRSMIGVEWISCYTP